MGLNAITLKNQNTSVHSSVIHERQKVTTTEKCPSADEGINKMW